MRGAARIGGKAFRIPSAKEARDGFNPLEALDLVGDLPVAPVLEPINDEWSWSIGADPADPRDCARYPASPYCGEIPLEFGKPFGFTPEIKTNGCETCFYLYPVILWLKVTPQIICKRDPNCDRAPAPPPYASKIPKDLPEVVADRYTSPECAAMLSAMHESINEENRAQKRAEHKYKFTKSKSNADNLSQEQSGEFIRINNLGIITTHWIQTYTTEGRTYGEYLWDGFQFNWDSTRETSVGIPAVIGFFYKTFSRSGNACPNPPPILPPPPLPPTPPPRPKRDKDMCCNDCADSKDNTEKLLREIKEIKKALGTGAYPIEVPESLLGADDGKTFKAESNAEYLFWLTKQIDALVGEFPIKIEVKDLDLLKSGDQTKTIEIPNIGEAIAEMYGLVLKNTVNEEVQLQMLLRLAAEVIATKNGVIVTQDYARANAGFLGYKGNFKAREMSYNFDFASVNLDPNSKEPIILEKIVTTKKGYVQGWELADNETIVGFLQKLMFAAGIIKAVFFRGGKLAKKLGEEVSSMSKDEKATEMDWDDFKKQVNNPTSLYNKDSIEKPEIKEELRDPRKP